MDVKDRTAVITGASRGLGAGIAKYFEANGVRLALCSRSRPVLPDSERVLARQLDVTDEAAVDAFAAEAAARFGHLDLWINNAGLLEPIDALRDVDADAFRRLIDVNVTGVFLGSRAYVRHVRASGAPGVLVNISSGASTTAYAGWSAYGASKAAVDLMTRCIQVEEQGTGLRVHAIAPGVIDTDMQALIRTMSPERFPMVDRFVAMKVQDSFSTVEFVASELLAIAFDPSRASDEVVLRLPPGKAPAQR